MAQNGRAGSCCRLDPGVIAEISGGFDVLWNRLALNE
jgi:hypothetical protein